MEKVGKVIVKLRIPILIISFLLLIPAGLGYVYTRVNYDILYYLPGDIETMKGQDILLDILCRGQLRLPLSSEKVLMQRSLCRAWIQKTRQSLKIRLRM